MSFTSLSKHRRGRFSALCLSLTLAAITAAPVARADLPAAQALLDEGNRAAASGDYGTALSRFNAAYAQYPGANILLNIGTALRRLGRHAEAGTVYERYLRDPGANPDRIPEIERALAEIDGSVSRVTISIGEPGARLWVDGREIGGFVSGGAVRLDPGEHTLGAGRGTPTILQTVRVGAGESRSIVLGGPAAAPAMAPVIVPGPAVAYAEEPEPPMRPRRRAMSPQRAVGIALDVVGAVGMATGIGLGCAAIAIESAASDHCLGGGAACEPRGLELTQQAKVYGQATSAAFGIGGALLIAGLIVGGTAPRYDTSASPARSPRVGFGFGSVRGGGLLTLEGSW